MAHTKFTYIIFLGLILFLICGIIYCFFKIIEIQFEFDIVLEHRENLDILKRIKNRFRSYMLPSIVGLPRTKNSDRRLRIARQSGVVSEEQLDHSYQTDGTHVCEECNHSSDTHSNVGCSINFLYTLNDRYRVTDLCGCRERQKSIILNCGISSAREKLERAYYAYPKSKNSIKATHIS